MTAQILTNIFTHEHNQAQVSEQEYLLALDEYDRVVQSFTIASPESINKLRAARTRRNIAFDRFMGAR